MKATAFHLILFGAGILRVAAQLEVLPLEQPQAVFPGENPVRVLLRNAGTQLVESQLRVRLFQMSSSVVMPVGNPQPWKKLAVLSGQTIVESVSLKFPDVRSVTRFQVRWLDEANNNIGQTLVTVFPTNLLQELAALAGEKSFGVLDPQERITPLLKTLKLEFTDLAQGERLDSFGGSFAIIGPFDAAQPLATDLRKRAIALAGRGVGVILIEPQPKVTRVADLPRILTSGRIVSVTPETFANIGTSPLAQEHLLQSARLALNPNWLMTRTEP